MFERLSGRLGEIFDRLKRRGALSEADVTAVLREVRVALLEADVALPVVKDFISTIKDRAIGHEVLRSITPAQQVIKIVHDGLVTLLGGEGQTPQNLAPNAPPPAVILLVGLQGSGKTTSAGKIALRLKTQERKRVLLASLDVTRPAAQLQLALLAEQAGVTALPIVAGQNPLEITLRALKTARLEGYDILLLDSAGRLAIDTALMEEVAAVKAAALPAETLLVLDAMTGQDAVGVAQRFQADIGLTGIIMTRLDGDARGGGALSVRAVTGAPIKWVGTGEKITALEPFYAERVAGRILGMGDIVTLVERAAQTIDKEDAERLATKALESGFDMDDLLQQLRQIQKLGGMSGILAMMPGVAKIKAGLEKGQIDEKLLARQEAIILSMTKAERRDPRLIQASRKRRIALGSGTLVQDVNRLLKQWQQMNEMMKQMRKLGRKNMLRQGLAGLLGKTGLPMR
jgi:signal recognition particle subunit SRP54